jgi:hypothetical protein
VVGGAYVLLAPPQPATVSFPVFTHARTYLEVEIDAHSGGWLEGTEADEYDIVKLYYTRLGGRFENSQRVLVSSVKTTGHIQERATRFYQPPNDSLAAIQIHLLDKDSLELSFKPPLVFPMGKGKAVETRPSLPSK